MKNKNEAKNKSNLTVRILFYIAGLIIMTVGVAISVRADLGVSTISSIPYTMTCVAGIDLGIATIIFSIFMVLLQIVLLRKEYKIINLLQLPVGILFGLFLTFCCNLTVYIPEPSNFLIKLIMTLISTVPVSYTHLDVYKRQVSAETTVPVFPLSFQRLPVSCRETDAPEENGCGW